MNYLKSKPYGFLVGVCVEGDFSGPQATDTCPSIISEACGRRSYLVI